MKFYEAGQMLRHNRRSEASNLSSQTLVISSEHNSLTKYLTNIFVKYSVDKFCFNENISHSPQAVSSQK